MGVWEAPFDNGLATAEKAVPPRAGFFTVSAKASAAHRLGKAAGGQDGESSCFRVLSVNESIITSLGGYPKVQVNGLRLWGRIIKPCSVSTTNSRRRKKEAGTNRPGGQSWEQAGRDRGQMTRVTWGSNTNTCASSRHAYKQLTVINSFNYPHSNPIRKIL